MAAPLVRRRLRLPPAVVTATAATAPVALCVLFPRSRARDAGACVLQMWAYLATYQMPNDDPEALERRVRIAYPVRADRFLGRGTTPTLRLQRLVGRPGRFRAWEKVLDLVALALVPVPARHRRVRAAAPPRAVRAHRDADLRDVRHRSDRLLGGAHRAALVRRSRRPDGRRAHAGAAAHDGRVRRGVLGVRLAASVRFSRRQPPGRHAVAALRHLHHGRPPTGSDRTAGGPARLDLRRHAGRRPRLPGRALHRRPGRGPRARRGDPPRPRRPPRRGCGARPRRYRGWRHERAHERAVGPGHRAQPGAAGRPTTTDPHFSSRSAASSRWSPSWPRRSPRCTCSCPSSRDSTTRGSGSSAAGRCG